MRHALWHKASHPSSLLLLSVYRWEVEAEAGTLPGDSWAVARWPARPPLLLLWLAALGHDFFLLVPAPQALNIYSLTPVISMQCLAFISTYPLLFGTGRDGGVQGDPFLQIAYTSGIVCLA